MNLRVAVALAAISATPVPLSGDTTRPGLVSFRPVAIPEDTPAHLVSALAQDRDGFLWIGTQGGLVRYDGYTFRTYSPTRESGSIGGAYIRTLRAASDGRLWAGTFADGVSVYDPATDRFARFRHVEGDAGSLSHNRVEGIAEDRDGTIWAATYAGLDRIDPRSGAIDHFRHDPRDPSSLADNRTRGVLVDRAGRLWVGGSGGVQRLVSGTRRFERMGPPPDSPESLSGIFASVFFEDSAGRIWIGSTDAGAAVHDPATGTWRRLRVRRGEGTGLSHYWVYGFAEVAGEVWVATFGGGVDVLDPAALDVVDRLRHDATQPTSLADDRVGAVLVDRSGIVWVGTWGEGLARHDPGARGFRQLRFSARQPSGLSHAAAVRALESSSGEVWVGTNGNGVDVFDDAWRRVGTYRPSPREEGELSDGSVTCLAETSDGSIWVATLDGTLHRRSRGSPRFVRLSAQTGLPGGPIRAMAEAPAGTLWIASANGLARLDTATSDLVSYRHDPGDPQSLTSNTIESVAVMPDGSIWAGSDSGLNVIDPSTGRVTRVLHDSARPDSLPNNWVPDLAVIGDRLWAATPAGAVILSSWDGTTARFESVAARIGRAASAVEAIVTDLDGGVWLGPRLRVDPRAWTYREFGPAEGVDFRTFFIASRARTRQGALLFGSPEGLLVISPRAIAPWSYRPGTVITGLRIDGVERFFGARPATVTLPPRTRSIEVGFAALDFSSPDRNIYRYRLDGFDGGWAVAGAARRSVTYTNLAPGTYTLHVEGSNRMREWSGDDLRVAIVVLPAFYQTGWFQALLVLAALAAGYSGYRIRVRQLRQRSHELERLVSERTAELNDAYVKIQEASLTDPLTQLRNRRFLEQAIGQDLELARRHARQGDAGHDLVCLLLDIDHFKSVNDRYGHAAGDAVLAQTADVLRSSVRTSDYAVRWGGEEFLVVARFIDRAEAAPIAEKIRAAVEAREFTRVDGPPLRVTCSIGYAAYPCSVESPDATSWEEVINQADAALYEAKRGGRNQCRSAASCPAS
jgi:diguanylate cyclase (GGDEF)-like protein